MLEDSTSIARALLLTLESAPCGHPRLTAGVLCRAPGDAAVEIATRTAEALGMEVVKVRLAGFEYHPGAINLFAHDRFEAAVAKGRPVLVIFDGAHEADRGLLPVLASAVAKRVEEQPCAILAICTSAGLDGVVADLAEGLEVDASRIAAGRTSAENARLAEWVARANAD